MHWRCRFGCFRFRPVAGLLSPTILPPCTATMYCLQLHRRPLSCCRRCSWSASCSTSGSGGSKCFGCSPRPSLNPGMPGWAPTHSHGIAWLQINLMESRAFTSSPAYTDLSVVDRITCVPRLAHRAEARPSILPPSPGPSRQTWRSTRTSPACRSGMSGSSTGGVKEGKRVDKCWRTVM